MCTAEDRLRAKQTSLKSLNTGQKHRQFSYKANSKCGVYSLINKLQITPCSLAGMYFLIFFEKILGLQKNYGCTSSARLQGGGEVIHLWLASQAWNSEAWFEITEIMAYKMKPGSRL